MAVALAAGRGAAPGSRAVAAGGASGADHWWETRTVAALLVLAAAVPLLYPPIPPLVDLIGHMGQYRVELDLARSPFLQRYYTYHWAAIGNLGLDLLVKPLAPLIGLEAAVKLIVLMIPPLTVAGFLWVSREVHGRVPPTAFFAIPFAYGHPFLFGFVNFALSMALAFLAFGLWLRLGRLGRTGLRLWLFVPISLVVFFCHTYGWGALGLMCFSAEAVRQHDRGVGWFRAGFNAVLQALVMALPLVIMLVWRSESHGLTAGDWFDWNAKMIWLKTALRDRWAWFDMASLVLAGMVVGLALFHPRMTFSRNLAFSALVLIAGFVLLPRILFESAYADMRLAPYMMAVLLLAIRFRGDAPRRLGSVLAIAGLVFVVARLGGNTISLAIAADDQRAKLHALGHMPEGARVASFYQLPCKMWWSLPRNSHLGAMVIVRRDGFSNDQWLVEGANLLGLKNADAGYFAFDPSEIVRPNICPDRLHNSINRALADLPRDDFDFIWLIDPPPFDLRLTQGMQQVWRGPHSILYRLH